jgi:hypothetical protein
MRYLALMLLVAIFVAACATQPPPTAFEPPSFWSGLLHGAISPITLFVSFFDSDVRIYAFPNSGWWYDFGFVIGAAASFGATGREGEKYYARYYVAGYEEGLEAGKTSGRNSN